MAGNLKRRRPMRALKQPELDKALRSKFHLPQRERPTPKRHRGTVVTAEARDRIDRERKERADRRESRKAQGWAKQSRLSCVVLTSDGTTAKDRRGRRHRPNTPWKPVEQQQGGRRGIRAFLPRGGKRASARA